MHFACNCSCLQENQASVALTSLSIYLNLVTLKSFSTHLDHSRIVSQNFNNSEKFEEFSPKSLIRALFALPKILAGLPETLPSLIPKYIKKDF